MVAAVGAVMLSAGAAPPALAGRSASADAGTATVRISEAHTDSGSGAQGGSGRGRSETGSGGADDAVTLPPPTLSLSPRHRAVVGVDLVVTATVAAVREPAVATPEGTDVVRLTVASVAVDFGDGSVVTVPAGTRAPVTVEARHAYADAAAHTVTASATWSGLYVPATGPATGLPDLTVAAAPLVVPTVEIRSVLVE